MGVVLVLDPLNFRFGGLAQPTLIRDWRNGRWGRTVSLLAGFTGAIAFAATVFETYVVPESVRPAWLPAGAVGISAIVDAQESDDSGKRSGGLAERLEEIRRGLFGTRSADDEQNKNASSRSRTTARKRRPKGDLDAMAAAIILQAYLDSARGPASG